MNAIDGVPKELQINPDDLMKESVRTCLNQKLSKVDSEIFILAGKYGVKDVF